MAFYKILIKPSAVKELESIPGKDRQRIVYRIQGLAENPRPHGSEKLSNKEKYRLRQGSYRILYQIKDEDVIVVVIRVGKRSRVYRK